MWSKTKCLTKSRHLAAVCLFGYFIASIPAYGQDNSDSRLSSIRATKTIKIAYRPDARPYSFLNDKNEIAGFTIDICRLVVTSIKQQLGLDDLKIEWVPVSVQTRFAVVANRKADIECGASTVTLGRMKEIDFSNYVFIETTGLLVKRASNFRSLSDMSDKKIAVISGTTNERAIQEQMAKQKINLIVVPVKTRDEGVAELEAGHVDGFASDKLLLVGAHMKNPQDLIMLPDDLSVEPYAIVLPRGDWALRLAVNTGLAHTYRTGQVATILNYWFERIGLNTGPVLKIMYGLGALAD